VCVLRTYEILHGRDDSRTFLEHSIIM